MVKLPDYHNDDDSRMDRVLDNVLDHDQFDDWIVDPLYYRDRLADRSQLRKQLVEALKGGSIEAGGYVSVDLPRASENTVKAFALPLFDRVLADFAIDRIMRRIPKTELVNKVHGFQYYESAPKGDPLFDLSGSGLIYALSDMLENLRVSNQMILVDTKEFLCNAKIAKLRTVIMNCDFEAQGELDFLDMLVFRHYSGLPAIDDAFSCLYNFYFHGIDLMLFKQEIPWVRHGDDFFVFSDSVANLVMSQMHDVDLDSRIKCRVTEKNWDEATNEQKEKTLKGVFDTGGVDVVGGISMPMYMESAETGATWDNFTAMPSNRILDAYKCLPYLRHLNQGRFPGVCMATYDRATPLEFADHQDSVSNNIDWLLKTLERAVANNSDWQLIWSMQLLSDAPHLADSVHDHIVKLTGNISNNLSRAAIYLFVARCKPELIKAEDGRWHFPDRDYFDRIQILAAYYMRQHGHENVWGNITSKLGNRQPRLIRYLSSS